MAHIKYQQLFHVELSTHGLQGPRLIATYSVTQPKDQLDGQFEMTNNLGKHENFTYLSFRVCHLSVFFHVPVLTHNSL